MKKANSDLNNKFLLVLSFANFFDSSVIVATGLALPVWSVVFGIDSFGIGILGALGANCFGAAVGALFGGYLSDKIGRNKAYLFGLTLIFIGLLVCIIAYNFYFLVVGFTILGIAVGICAPVSWTYLSELSDKEERSSNLGISHIARPLAIVSMYVLFFIFSIFIPSNDSYGNVFPSGTYWIFDGMLGSRLLFVALLICSVVAIIQNKNIYESESWVLSKKSEDTVTIREIISNIKSIKSIIFLILVYAPWNIVAGTIAQFMPTIAKVAGVEGVNLAIISITVCLFSLVSVVVFSKLVKKFSYKSLFAFGAISGICSLMFMYAFIFQHIFLEAKFEWFIYIFAVLWGAQTGFSAQCFYSIWASELFPTKARGTIQGFMFFVIRGLSGLWSIFAFGILDASTEAGASSTILCMIILLIVTAISGLLFCPKTQNKSLEQIEKERYSDLKM